MKYIVILLSIICIAGCILSKTANYSFSGKIYGNSFYDKNYTINFRELIKGKSKFHYGKVRGTLNLLKNGPFKYNFVETNYTKYVPFGMEIIMKKRFELDKSYQIPLLGHISKLFFKKDLQRKNINSTYSTCYSFRGIIMPSTVRKEQETDYYIFPYFIISYKGRNVLLSGKKLMMKKIKCI